MPDDKEGSEFAAIETPGGITPNAKAEADQLESRPAEPPPNSVAFNLGKFCQVRWHAESSAPLFCFLSIVALLVFGVILAAVSALNSALTWPPEVFKFLGQGILTLVGAVVGASAASGSSSRSSKRGPRA